MWETIFNVAIGNGIFALLFVALLVYQLRDSANREKKYQDTIEKLNEHLNVIVDIKEDVDEIKKIISYPSKKGNKNERKVETESKVV